jgi:hypothetical protein
MRGVDLAVVVSVLKRRSLPQAEDAVREVRRVGGAGWSVGGEAERAVAVGGRSGPDRGTARCSGPSGGASWAHPADELVVGEAVPAGECDGVRAAIGSRSASMMCIGHVHFVRNGADRGPSGTT